MPRMAPLLAPALIGCVAQRPEEPVRELNSPSDMRIEIGGMFKMLQMPKICHARSRRSAYMPQWRHGSPETATSMRDFDARALEDAHQVVPLWKAEAGARLQFQD